MNSWNIPLSHLCGKTARFKWPFTIGGLRPTCAKIKQSDPPEGSQAQNLVEQYAWMEYVPRLGTGRTGHRRASAPLWGRGPRNRFTANPFKSERLKCTYT